MDHETWLAARGGVWQLKRYSVLIKPERSQQKEQTGTQNR